MKSLLSALEPILLRNSRVKPEAIVRASRRWRPRAGLIETFAESGVDARSLALALAQLYRLPMQPGIDCDAINRGLLASMPVQYAQTNRLLPLASDGSELLVATADPSNYVALDDLGVAFQMTIRPIVTPCDVLDGAISRIAKEIESRGIHGQILDLDQAHLETAARLLSQEPTDAIGHTTAAVLELVRGLIREAVNEEASDLRLEPGEGGLRARYSVRGLSYNLMSAPKCFKEAIIGCVKTMAGMDAAESDAGRQGYISTRFARRTAGLIVSIIRCADGDGVMLGFDRRPDSADFRGDRIGPKETSPFDIPGKWPLELPRCPGCGEAIAVWNALFCRACGGRLAAPPRSEGDRRFETESVDRGRRAVGKDWRLY